MSRSVSELVKVGILCQTENRDTFKVQGSVCRARCGPQYKHTFDVSVCGLQVIAAQNEKENQEPVPSNDENHHAIASQLKSLNMGSDDAPGASDAWTNTRLFFQ